MKTERTLAFRRYMKWIKFKKRMNKWTSGFSYDTRQTKEWRNEILKGESCTFLKTTGNPCNCWGCSGYNKYIRTPKHIILKEAYHDIEDI